jgi:hypothetical protein
LYNKYSSLPWQIPYNKMIILFIYLLIIKLNGFNNQL